jgi:hypothetical protein
MVKQLTLIAKSLSEKGFKNLAAVLDNAAKDMERSAVLGKREIMEKIKQYRSMLSYLKQARDPGKEEKIKKYKGHLEELQDMLAEVRGREKAREKAKENPFIDSLLELQAVAKYKEGVIDKDAYRKALEKVRETGLPYFDFLQSVPESVRAERLATRGKQIDTMFWTIADMLPMEARDIPPVTPGQPDIIEAFHNALKQYVSWANKAELEMAQKEIRESLQEVMLKHLEEIDRTPADDVEKARKFKDIVTPLLDDAIEDTPSGMAKRLNLLKQMKYIVNNIAEKGSWEGSKNFLKNSILRFIGTDIELGPLYSLGSLKRSKLMRNKRKEKVALILKKSAYKCFECGALLEPVKIMPEGPAGKNMLYKCPKCGQEITEGVIKERLKKIERA